MERAGRVDMGSPQGETSRSEAELDGYTCPDNPY